MVKQIGALIVFFRYLNIYHCGNAPQEIQPTKMDPIIFASKLMANQDRIAYYYRMRWSEQEEPDLAQFRF